MSLRVWLDPTKCPLQPNPNGNRYIAIEGSRQHVHEEGGLPYYHKSLMAPMHRQLRRAVILVTYHEKIDDGQQTQRIVPGRYVHGRFEAVVKLGIHHQHSKWVLEIQARAPTESLLKRWLNKLLAGLDTPSEAYSESLAVRSDPHLN